MSAHMHSNHSFHSLSIFLYTHTFFPLMRLAVGVIKEARWEHHLCFVLEASWSPSEIMYKSYDVNKRCGVLCSFTVIMNVMV